MNFKSYAERKQSKRVLQIRRYLTRYETCLLRVEVFQEFCLIVYNYIWISSFHSDAWVKDLYIVHIFRTNKAANGS